jgi:hypothetical protein
MPWKIFVHYYLSLDLQERIIKEIDPFYFQPNIVYQYLIFTEVEVLVRPELSLFFECLFHTKV